MAFIFARNTVAGKELSMETPVNHWEHADLEKLIDAKVESLEKEDKRLNERLKVVENTTQQISAINVTLQKQSDNISEISTNISRMVKKQEEESDRIKILENKDAEKWKSTVKSVAQIAAGLISGLLLAWLKNVLGL